MSSETVLKNITKTIFYSHDNAIHTYCSFYNEGNKNNA